MEDPVVLPSGAIMDRAVIRNHISKFQIDPFTGDHLTEDMLVSDDNLRARIQEFISGMDPKDTTGAQSDPDVKKIYHPRRAEWDIDFSNVEIPTEFRDALENTLMREPVVLPSGRTVDRLVIYDHICESSVDPFSGRYLTEDMLVPDNDLAEKISKFASSVRQGMQIAEYRQRKNADWRISHKSVR
ncbi:hypothetical protein MKW92_008767 [Papaver armeniacum]|nr:hypothetical protein MKW92_008767 [Papaver armeniacum]